MNDPCGYLLSFPITQEFGNPETQSPMGVHTGMDLAMPVGSEVPAVRAGHVSAAWRHELPQGNPNWPQGICAIIACGDGERYWYAHLSRLDVVVGDAVVAGQVIGLSGATGAATGPHLHLERNIHQDVPDGPVWPGNWRPIDPHEEVDMLSDTTLEQVRMVVREEVAAGAKAVADTITAGFNVTLPTLIDREVAGDKKVETAAVDSVGGNT